MAPLVGTENPEQLKIERAALFAWWNSEDGIEQALSEVWWDSHKDCWTDGWEAGYRAAQRAETERLKRADVLLIDGEG